MPTICLTAAIASFSAACGGSPVGPTGTPSAPEGLAAITTPPSPTPSPAQSTFSIRLPIELSDSANTAYGLNPFGVHEGDHSIDGHPGWDIEYRSGASVRAAADGIVQSVMADGFTPGMRSVQIQHQAGSQAYRTTYTNIAMVAPGISAGTSVTAGQPIGVPGARSQVVGRTPITFYMTHFQVDDFAQNEGLTNSFAVSPETRLDPSARAAFEAIWRQAVFKWELVEPFVTNPRNAAFPFTRTWTLQSGTLPARMQFRRLSPTSNDFEYTLMSFDGAAIDSGSASVDPVARPFPTIDLRSADGSLRLGVYDILDQTMQISVGPAGAPRTTSLDGGSRYTTAR